MKTLDEVITVMDHVEFCCTSCKLQFDCDEVECFLEDALHYLREYRDKVHSLDIDIANHCRSFEQLGVEIARYQEAVKNCEEAENKYRMLKGELEGFPSNMRMNIRW